MCKVRLGDDLIAHLGKQLLTVGEGNAAAELDVDDPSSAFEGLCYGITLTDAGAFAESLETLIRARGLHVSRKSEDYQGFEVHRISFFGTQFNYTVTDRVFVIGLGEPGAAELRAILDESSSRRAGTPPRPMPEAIEQRLDHALAAWDGIGVGDLAVLGDTLLSSMESALTADHGEIPPDFATARGIATAVMELLTRYELADLVTVTKTDGDEYRTQMIW
jgi:hypothetical protein